MTIMNEDIQAVVSGGCHRDILSSNQIVYRKFGKLYR